MKAARERKPCSHCKKLRVIPYRGLCYACYFDPAIRPLYPKSKPIPYTHRPRPSVRPCRNHQDELGALGFQRHRDTTAILRQMTKAERWRVFVKILREIKRRREIGA